MEGIKIRDGSMKGIGISREWFLLVLLFSLVT